MVCYVHAIFGTGDISLVLSCMLKRVCIKDLELFEVRFRKCWYFIGVICIMEQMLGHHGCCELEICDLSLVF